MKTKKQKNNNKTKVMKGFSIGEVLLALVVLSFGMMASISLMSGSMQDTMRSRDLLVASMLSQEGTELVRNIRDNNVTEKSAEDVYGEAFTGFPATGKKYCTVDYDFNADLSGNSFNFLQGLNCSSPSYELYFVQKGSNGDLFYSHKGSGDDNLTKFKRRIIISNEAPGKKGVVSMVVWDGTEFPDNKSECNIGQNCTYSETILTAWINIE